MMGKSPSRTERYGWPGSDLEGFKTILWLKIVPTPQNIVRAFLLAQDKTPAQTNLSERRFIWKEIHKDQDSSEIPRIETGRPDPVGTLLHLLLLWYPCMAEDMATSSLEITSLPAPVRKIPGEDSYWSVLGHVPSPDQLLWSRDLPSVALLRLQGPPPSPETGDCDEEGEELLPEAKSIIAKRMARGVLGWYSITSLPISFRG